MRTMYRHVILEYTLWDACCEYVEKGTFFEEIIHVSLIIDERYVTRGNKWYVWLSYVMVCYVMLCYVMLGYAMVCYVMLCYVRLCYGFLCYAMLW